MSSLQPVSLGEGCTPLIRKSFDGCNLYVKLEWFSPTGSFKDRGAAVLISMLKRNGIDEIVIDSSGNAGASIAAYAAAAKIKVYAFAPSGTQVRKVQQMKALGAHVELVDGARAMSEARAMSWSDRVYYASHNWNAMFLQGTKTIGYELWEDLGFRAPDNIVVPIGAGSNLLGCNLAFGELRRNDEVAHIPRLFGVQPRNCCPIHVSFVSGMNVDGACSRTIAEGAAISDPPRLTQVIEAIRSSGGSTMAVTESEIASASSVLASEGLYVEPTAALAFAGFLRLAKEGAIGAEETTVAVLTGTGLKHDG